MNDVIIIGAGASGLMAARELSAKGLQVSIIEARDRIGGRINTIVDNGYVYEAGAEFIHGKLETTLALMKEAGLAITPTSNNFYQISNGKWHQSNQMIEHEDLLLQKLRSLKTDLSIFDFLEQEFSQDIYIGLRESLLQYVTGYYAGDPKKASAITFLNEWQSEDEEQFRPVVGYGNLMQFLLNDCIKHSASIKLSTVVKQIEWCDNYVKIISDDGSIFEASKLILAIPLGVWQSNKTYQAHISFSPTLPDKIIAAKQLGFGDALKISVKFNKVFWEDLPLDQSSEAIRNFGFVFADATIGTWWSQNPRKIPVLVGWVAGPPAADLSTLTDDTLKEHALQSLATVFNVTMEIVNQHLQSITVHNWSQDPFALGGYTYSTVRTKEARKVLAAPTANTLFFAGECLYDGTETGTVEAALISGRRAAEEIMRTTSL